jgi:hypothetical protein
MTTLYCFLPQRDSLITRSISAASMEVVIGRRVVHDRIIG